jgi:hypothetical protein
MGSQGIYRIVPVQGGRLMISCDDGTPVLGNQDFPSEDLAVAALQDLAKSHGMDVLVRYRPDGKVDRVVIGHDLGAESPPVALTVTLPATLYDALSEISAESALSHEEVIRRAVVLMTTAWDALGEGNRLSILTPDDEVVRDIVGIRPAKPAGT